MMAYGITGLERVKYMRKASVVFRVYRTFTSATCNTVDHILTGRSHIGRAPKIVPQHHNNHSKICMSNVWRKYIQC